ncbi:MAG: hypothetical protein EON55_02775 [Alphaproteobacteria bacterium]|nr:MAG: hypothetical protein EON55_02775 [Alphaproteobacteria bacterium]
MEDNQINAEQMMLMELPKAEPSKDHDKQEGTSPTSIASPQLPATTVLGTLATLFETFPDEVAGVVLVDPRAIAIDPVNVRHGTLFDPEARGELIESMRMMGNTVPVRLRRAPEGGPGFLCPSGSQRLGAALHIQRDNPGFRLRAVIAEAMSDAEAFEIAEADNAGRSGVTPMQQARQWTTVLERVYGGNRHAFIAATGRSASSVSRTLALLALPNYVQACCNDTEALTPYFAEQLVPRIGDAAEEPAIRRRAQALIAAGRRLPGPALVKALLTDPAVLASIAPTWASTDGSRTLVFKPNRKGGGRIDVTCIADLTHDERRAALKALDTLLKSLATSS